MPGRAWIAGKDLAREPDAVRAAIGVTGQFAAVDGLLTGFENLVLMGRLHHLGKRETRQRATDLLEKFDQAAATLRRWHDSTTSADSGQAPPGIQSPRSPWAGGCTSDD